MVFGSYNYSLAARCYNWETIIVADTRQDDVLRFDALWDDLADRVLTIYQPNPRFFPPQEQVALLEFMNSLPPVPQSQIVNPYKKAKNLKTNRRGNTRSDCSPCCDGDYLVKPA